MRRTAVLLVLLHLACSSSGNNAPRSSGDGGMDVIAGDPDLVPTGLTPALCSAAIDLNAVGTVTGDTLTYHGNTDHAPSDVRMTPCQPNGAWPVVMRYRVRGDNVHLRLSTNNPGGTHLFDTALWAMDRCADRAVVYECNDDDPDTPVDVDGASTAYLRTQRQGTELFIGLAGYAMARRGAVGHGDFVLTITETPSATLGQACDHNVTGACLYGQDCAAYNDHQGTCVTPELEQEPDDDPAHGMRVDVSNSISVWARIDRPGDVDCFRFDVTEGATLFLQAGNGNGRCPWDLRGGGIL